MVKIQELKREARKLWESLHTYKGANIAPESFEQVSKRFGDRRRKDTWITIYARFEAELTYDAADDAALMLSCLADPSLPVGTAVLDAFLTFPDGLEMVQDALNLVYNSDYPTCEDIYGLPKLPELLARAQSGRGAALNAA